MTTTYANVHEVDAAETVGLQLFNALDTAWNDTLLDSGDSFDKRYDGLDLVGLALLSAPERSPHELGGDNPLGVLAPTGSPVSNLIERGQISNVSSLRYRSNHGDVEAQFDPTNLAVRTLDQIYPSVLFHGRFPINGAAKRFYLLNNPDETTSHNPSGLQTGFYGEIGAAGGIRLAEQMGIVAISGGNQIHDHIAARLWATMALIAVDKEPDEFNTRQITSITSKLRDSMLASVEHIKEFIALKHKCRLDEMEHAQYAPLTIEADRFLAVD